MALGIVKCAYDRSYQLIGRIWFAVSCGPLYYCLEPFFFVLRRQIDWFLLHMM